MEKLFGNPKGHGYLRKTNLGLVSSILLTSSLFVTLGTNPIFAAETVNIKPNENVSSTGKTEAKDDFVREETVTVKETELKAKVEEVKKSGVTVEEKPVEVVGTAKTETEEAPLKKDAETKIDEQIKALEEAKKEEEARKAKVKEVEELKKYFIENKQKKYDLINHLNSRDAEIDKGNSKTFSNFSSNKDNVYFLDVDTLDLTSELTLQNMGKNRVTNVAKKINVTLNTKKGVDNTDAYIFKVRNGETISYNTNLSEKSYLSKKFGIASISIKRTYNFNFELKEQVRYYDVLTNNLTETNYIFTNIANSSNPKSGTPHVTTEYLYKDKLGKVISLKELYIKAINDGIFYNNELLNSENISDESLKQPESYERPFGSDTKLYSTGNSVTETAEGGVAKTINYRLNPNLKIYSLLDNNWNEMDKSKILENVDYKKLMEPVSANYHLVTYKKLINTGVVPNEAPKLEVPEYISKKGEPLTLEVSEYRYEKGEPLVQPELPAFELNNEHHESDVEVPKPQQKEQTKKSTFDETSKTNENEVQTSSEKTLPAKHEKEVVHQTESEKVVSNKQVLPNTGMSDTSLYYTISASIMSLLGMMSLKFKKKDME